MDTENIGGNVYKVRRAVYKDRKSLVDLVIERAIVEGHLIPSAKQALEFVDKFLDKNNPRYDNRVFGDVGNVRGAKFFSVTEELNYVRRV
jgi:hypothetical protein